MKIDADKTVFLVALTLLLAIGGCGLFPTETKEALPADHTDERGYAYHAPMPNNDVTTCKDCHGDNLKGGVSEGQATPSCYQCHGSIWEIDARRENEAPNLASLLFRSSNSSNPTVDFLQANRSPIINQN
ncbi:hypothetical protein Ctha_2111 [Chloroherpeton thalassium ATCC 35110]|uniref:Uncharacterized protein n=1 Tax=Chloroherpeton thalassium (strain ATCC 35110 / GB-78) TaxID=517418 RepID=B3QVG3_CHLT3|nr:hypothetical protein [Chloroherpeton thalassium]ACF14563.1 hypothetical protein Ctha_2111 [Chloroherpeton thalassium ATCC 35110]